MNKKPIKYRRTHLYQCPSCSNWHYIYLAGDKIPKTWACSKCQRKLKESLEQDSVDKVPYYNIIFNK